MSNATPFGLGFVIAGVLWSVTVGPMPASTHAIIGGFALILAGIGFELHIANRGRG